MHQHGHADADVAPAGARLALAPAPLGVAEGLHEGVELPPEETDVDPLATVTAPRPRRVGQEVDAADLDGVEPEVRSHQIHDAFGGQVSLGLAEAPVRPHAAGVRGHAGQLPPELFDGVRAGKAGDADNGRADPGKVKHRVTDV